MAGQIHPKMTPQRSGIRCGRCPWGLCWGSFSGNPCRGYLQGIFGALEPTLGDFGDSLKILYSRINSSSQISHRRHL